MTIHSKIYNLNSFQRQYKAILQLSVADTIPALIWNDSRDSLLSAIDWNNVLSIASILCYSENIEHLDASLRIAQTCMAINSDSEKKLAATVILNTLTNHPAIKLGISRGLVQSNYNEFLPFTFQLQNAKVEFESTIQVGDNVIRLNRFQKKVFSAYQSFEAISISAPTSAGKSFILYNVLIDFVFNRRCNIVYIVPTRALISQVEEDLRLLIKTHEISNVEVSTVPQFENSQDSHIFVFTQERLHWFLIENYSIPIDLIIVDEAQKIEDGNRGILLQQKIENVIKLNPNVRIFFSSPFTSNPEVLLENTKSVEKTEVVNTQFVSVNQNLIFVRQIPRKVDQYSLKLILQEETIDLGNIILKDRPGTSEFKKMAYITEAFSHGSNGNLIYSNGAADAEKIAAIYFQNIPETLNDVQISELIKLIKKTIHSEYSLAKVLSKGIAFHYGNMPLLIRQEIERLFKEGIIKFLICTSTLLEGVNLPSKIIFIRKPTRGRNTPLSSNDFWNLAGRAGRWGKEFSGNIICIDPQNWDIPPDPNRSKQVIKRATDHIKDNPNELISYIINGSPRELANTRQDLEFAFGYYYTLFLDNELTKPDPFYLQLRELFLPLSEQIIIPDYIIKRNPGISPLAQQSLFNYFSSNSGSVENLIPVYPEDENAYEEYKKLVGIIGQTLSFYPPGLDAPRAILLINWMRGRPLSYIISSSFASYQKNEKYKNTKTLPVVIRECMDDVENFVRFRFAKDSSCYVDILRYYFEINSRKDLISKIPDLSLWLEFGVSQKTHLSLLALGLTRNTVTEITQYIPNSQLNKEQALTWLKSIDFNLIELSPIIIADINKII